MVKIRAFITAASITLLSVTDAARAQPGRAELVPFDEFLRGTAAARFEDYAPRKDLAVKRSEDFEAMRQHVLSLYEGVTVAHSFLMDEQYFDCVPIDQQPSVRQLGLKHAQVTPPPPIAEPDEKSQEPGEPHGLASPLTLGLVDPFGNAVSCEEGTIPMRRVTLEETTRFETLEKFFHKSPWDGVGQPPQTEEPPSIPVATHQYAFAYQNVSNHGGSSWLNLWSPAINGDASQIFSLSQHWYVGGQEKSLQTVEGGWQAYPLKYHTTSSVLFIYWTADDYNQTGCYNLDCAGFVQTSSKWSLGGSWPTYSIPGGKQYEFQLQWKLTGGKWWLFLQGSGRLEAVGYYPGTIYNRGQLTRFAQVIEYGGETVGTTSWPPMGSGGLAGLGYQQAAYQRNIFYLNVKQTSQWSNLQTVIPSPLCYTSIFFPASSRSSWGSYLYFGGPGGSSC
jgi:hypothetical protein